MSETSPGGSIIHRYKDKWLPSRMGFTDESSAKFAETPNEVYGRLFGKVQGLFDEALPRSPRIQVHTYHRSGQDGRSVCALVTSGMSDLEMTIPSGTKAPRRVELIFYCSEPRQEYLETMQWLAHFPHDQRTWVGSGHTIPNGDPPAPFFGSSILDTFLFIPPIVKKDQTLPGELILDGEGVHFLWLVPLTTAECNLKLAKGLNAILDLFGQHRHPHVFDPNRASYV